MTKLATRRSTRSTRLRVKDGARLVVAAGRRNDGHDRLNHRGTLVHPPPLRVVLVRCYGRAKGREDDVALCQVRRSCAGNILHTRNNARIKRLSLLTGNIIIDMVQEFAETAQGKANGR